jgi:hypothetical protein
MNPSIEDAIERIETLEELLTQKEVEYQVLLEEYQAMKVDYDRMIADRTYLIA